MIQTFFDRIAVRLVFWVVFWCSILTFADTLLQVYFEYSSEIRSSEQKINSYVRYHIPEVTDLVQQKNKSSVESFLQEMIHFSGLAYAAVIVDNEVYCQQGQKNACTRGCTVWPLWNATGKDATAGSLEVSTEMRSLDAYLFDGFGSRLIDNGIKIFLIGGFTFFIVQALVTRHLVSLARKVENIDLSKPFSPLQLQRKRLGRQHDELDMVVDGLNQMQQKANQAYAALSNNERRLLLFFNSTEEAIVGLDCRGVCTFANDKALQLLKVHSYEDIINKPLDRLIYSREETTLNRVFFQSVKDSLLQGSSVSVEESELCLINGRKIPVFLRTYPVFSQESVSGALIFINDISEKRGLLREKKLLTEAIQQIPMVVMITDADTRVQYVNPVAVSLTGYRKQSFIGKPVSRFIEKVEGELSGDEILEQARSGKQWAGIIECYSRYGKLLKFFTVISPVFDSGGRVANIIAVSREVSFEIAMRSELINSKKMDAVGRLSASFAHEFGNPLMGVRSVLKDLLQRDSCNEDDSFLLQLALEECTKMQSMVNDLQLKKNRAEQPRLREYAEDVIHSVLEDLKQKAQNNHVSLVLHFSTESKRALVRGDRLGIAIRNILVNGIEAMSEGGGNIDIRVQIQPKSDFLTIFIRDNGKGIRKEHQELVIEPFFSTKPEVVGTGLGLSIAYWLISGLGGEISFESDEGSGTVFKISVPFID